MYKIREELKQELARTSFRMGNLLSMQAETNEEAVNYFNEAWRMYKELKPRGKCKREDLRDDDFDALVSFWT